MIARIRKASDDKDKGFTLIELLVVIIIIGILSAIAIPVFMNQRKKAVDSSMKSDLRTAGTVVETAYTDNNAYPADDAEFQGLTDLKVSAGNILVYKFNTTTKDAYCVTITREGTAQPASRTSWIYDSSNGGLQTEAEADAKCSF